MGVLRVVDLGKSFGIEELFSHVSFEVAQGDKVGFVGANGAGKSTLMRCLMGREEFDAGNIAVDPADAVGYVEQEASFGQRPLREELGRAFEDILRLKEQIEDLEGKIAAEKNGGALEKWMGLYAHAVDRFERAGGYDYESRMKKIAFGLGFTEADLDKHTTEFSGGQRTRISLAKALLREPDFLFLDEPTNHLDIEMVEWLEDFLRGYRGGVLLISHDRFFLDRVANRIFLLENKRIETYKGNYTDFVRLKEERRASLESAYEKQQEHIKKTEEYIRKYKAGIKSKQARGREKQLGRLKRIVLPPAAAGFNYFAFNPPSQCAQRVAELEDAAARYGARDIFTHVSLLIKNGDGVALVGPNGAGKTTLLKVLIGELEPFAGRVKLGSKVKLGYFSQQHEGLGLENSLLDEITASFSVTEEQARHYLGAFLFKGDDVYKLVGDLSGGEKSRVAFLKLMLAGANFLVLDEPTNHLDIPAKEAVEEALMAFPGTFIAVSHDRYFLDKVTNCTLELKDGAVTEYNGNYSYYRDKKERLAKESAELAAAAAKEKRAQAETERKGKPALAKKAKQRTLSAGALKEKAQRLEGEIAMLEMELKGLEFRLNSPEAHTDRQASCELAEVYAQAEKKLAEKYALWAECAEEIE